MDFKNIVLGLKFSFSYFSILPLYLKESDDLTQKEVLKSMLFFFPLVGAVLALLAMLPYFFVQNPLIAILSGVLFVAFSGFIHLEAVIDVADAFYAKMAGKDAYTVIKEPTIGAIGALWGGSFLLLEVAGFSYLLLQREFFVLVMIAVTSRVTLLFLIYLFDFKSSFLSTLKESLSVWIVAFWGVVTLPFIFVGVIGYFVTIFLKKRLLFINGDVLGTSLVVVEVSLFYL